MEGGQPVTVVVGSGPNGLAAGIEAAGNGRSVIVFESHGTVGGGLRSAELTLPGFIHDVCSAVHPLGVSSPFFQILPLKDFGLEWVHPEIPLAHPFDDGTAAVLTRSISETGGSLGEDGASWERLTTSFVRHWPALAGEILAPLHWPRHPFLLARFGLTALPSARRLAGSLFRGERARALFAGLAGHSLLPLEKSGSAAFGMVLGLLGHAVGWPFPRGGSQALADALAGCLRSRGGEIRTGHPIHSLDELPDSAEILLDLSPREVLRIAGSRLSRTYQRRLEKFRYGPGVCKVDWALAEPIPWKAPECRWAGTVHLGGTFREIAASERLVSEGLHPERPFVILAQQSLFDPSRAPAGRQTGWAYCHVPNGSQEDMCGRIEAQVERFAPGFRDIILGRHVRTAAGHETYNSNYVGGDINGGAQHLRQLLSRPVLSPDPYFTGTSGLYICSASTPPGGGVHGMCGYHAAKAAIKRGG